MEIGPDHPVILCGLGQVGARVLEYLRVAGIPVVAIDSSCAPEDPRAHNIRLVRGDFRHRAVLEEAGIAMAAGVLVMTSDDLINISTALMVRHLNKDVRLVVRLFNENLIPRLGKAVSNTFALSVSRLTAPLLALTALTGQALGTFNVDSERFQVAELTISEESLVRQTTVAHAAARYRALVLAHLRGDGVEHFLLDVDGTTVLTPGDRLVVCGDLRDLAPLLAVVGEDDLTHVYFAGWLRRMGRVLRRTMSDIEWPVKVCTAVLVGVITLSTLVFYFGMDQALPQAFSRSVSVIATAGDLHLEQTKDPSKPIAAWQHLFVGGLRLTGAALLASFTAIFTNYLLRARLRGAFDIRRIPDSGHVIVAGLGNVGFGVVEELLQAGERVVVIEQQRDGRFMTPARRRRVAIIVGDATVPDVLRQANSAAARAVIAATDHELANLEIALMARDLNSQTRVVVRLIDPNLTQTLREAANIRFALSVPSLAAPAFVAALFGDRVQSVFMIEGRLLAAIELVVHPGDGYLEGHTVRVLAVDYRLLPVRLLVADKATPVQPMNHRLGVGDRLTVIVEVKDLERFLRRESVPRDAAVLVCGFNLPARPFVVGLLCQQNGHKPEGAEEIANHMPFRVGTHLTRGQAEDLLAVLQNEGVQGRILQPDSDQP